MSERYTSLVPRSAVLTELHVSISVTIEIGTTTVRIAKEHQKNSSYCFVLFTLLLNQV